MVGVSPVGFLLPPITSSVLASKLRSVLTIAGTHPVRMLATVTRLISTDRAANVMTTGRAGLVPCPMAHTLGNHEVRGPEVFVQLGNRFRSYGAKRAARSSRRKITQDGNLP